MDISLKEVGATCPPPQVKSDIVINPNAGLSGDGRGWSSNLYLKSEASKVVGSENIIYDLTWLIASNMTYAGNTYTFDDVEIWMYEYSGVQFPNTNRPAVETWVSPATTPAGVTNLKKVLNSGRVKIQSQTYDCIGFPVAMLDSPYKYSGNNSLVIYVQKKTKQTTPNPSGYISYRQNRVDLNIRVLANWEGDDMTPIPNVSKITTTNPMASFARVVFNRGYTNTTVKKFNCNADNGSELAACLSICSVNLNNPSFCEGENANLVATPKDYKNTVAPTYKWDILPSGVTDPGNVTSFNITKSGKYQVTMTATNLDGSACSSTKFVDIVVKPKPDPAGTITGSSNVCSGTNNVSFSVPAINNADSYIWTYSGTGATITNNGKDITINFASNATSGKLTVKGKNTCGEGNSSQDFDITVTTKPIISDITKSICSGLKFDTIPVANATNTIPAGTKYTWAVVADPEITGASPEASPQTNISQTLSNSATTSKIATYTVTATSGTAPNQCTSTFKVTITVNPKPPAAPLFTLTSQPTCSANGIAQVTPFLASPAVYIFKPSTGISIDGTGKITASSGKYKFVVIKDGCASDSSELLTMNDVPGKPTAPIKIISSGETTFCEGEFINLTASTIPAGATVNWTKNGTLFGNTNPLKVTESGTYAVSYTANGCTSFENDTIVTVNPLPSKPTITNADLNQQFCVSENADVSKLKPISGVVWFDVNGNIKNNLAELLTETSYYAAIKDANGCYTKSTDRIEVKVKIIQNPLSPVIGGPIVFCKADNKSIADLTPKSTITTEIRWFSNTDLTTPIPYIPATPLITGQYVPKSYENGCYSLNTTPISVTIEDPQAPALPTSKLCENNTISPKLFDFYANNNSIYYYSSNTSLIALANKNLVKGLNEKYYVRTVTNNGCYSAATEINIDLYFSSGIGVLPSPLVLTPVLCEIDKPDFALVEAKYNALPSTNGTIFWYQGKNDLLENNLPKNIQINSGSYWIAVKGADGCFSKKQEVKLTVDSGIKPTLKPIDLCYTSEYKVADLNIANVSNPIGILTWYYAKNGTVILKDLDPITNDPNVEYWATYKKTNTECESSEKVKLNLSWIKFNQPLQLDETSQKFCKSKTNKVSDLNISPNTSSNVAWFQTLTESTPIDPTTNLFEDKYYAAEFLMTTDNKYCVNSQRKMVDVTFYSPKLYPLVKESVCTKQNGSIEFLNPPAGYIFNWYETSNINVLDFTGAKYSKPLEKQSFKIVMEDAKGCKDEVTISMPACSDALIPQFLTPQSPGGNDKWVINFSAKYTKVQVRVFNRWGNEVYVSPIPYTDDWDGKRNNEYLPTGTYYYVIDKGNGDPIVTGFIELVK